jgi:hypothetical protein
MQVSEIGKSSMLLEIGPCYKVCLDSGIIVQLEILICYDYMLGVGIATGYGLDGLGWIPGSARFFILCSVQTDSGAHPASYPMDTVDSFPEG